MNIKFYLCSDVYYCLENLKNKKDESSKYDVIYFTDLNNLFNEVTQLDFFESNKNFLCVDFILDKSSFKDFEQVISNLNNIDGDLYFIVDESNKAFASYISKTFKKSVFKFNKFDARERIKFINNFLKINELDNILHNNNLYDYLLELLPLDFKSCEQELKKLLLIDFNKITLSDLSKIIYSNEDANLFYLIEKILLKDLDFVLDYLNDKSDDVLIMKLISLLANYIYKIYLYNLCLKVSHSSLNEIFSSEWEIKKLANFQKRYNILELSSLNKKLFMIDYGFKCGKITNLYNSFKLFLLKM